jgi:hypothetical protein
MLEIIYSEGDPFAHILMHIAQFFVHSYFSDLPIHCYYIAGITIFFSQELLKNPAASLSERSGDPDSSGLECSGNSALRGCRVLQWSMQLRRFFIKQYMLCF